MGSGKGLIHGKQIRDNSISVSKLDFDISGLGSGGAYHYNGNYEMYVTASITGDEQSTGLSPDQTPYLNSAFYVQVNGVVINLGDGVKNRSAYFSDDGGFNAVNINQISSSSVLYWNTSIANYILSPMDRITFEYEIGNASATSSNFEYTHDQNFGSTVWNINHSMSGFPNVTVVDNTGTVIEGDIQYIDANNITVTFTSVETGKAYLS